MTNPFNYKASDELLHVLFNPEGYLAFQKLINMKALTLKDCGFSSRSYDYNKQRELVFEEPIKEETGKRKWVRPSAREFIWLKILERCRKFGLEKDALLEIKKTVFEEWDATLFDRKYLDETIRYAQPLLEPKIGKDNFVEYSKYLKKVGLKGLLKEIGLTINTLDFFLFVGLNTRCNIGFSVTDDNLVTPFIDYKIMNVEDRFSMYENLLTKHFMFINLWDFLLKIPSLESAPPALKEMILVQSADSPQTYFTPDKIRRAIQGLPFVTQEGAVPVKGTVIEKLVQSHPFQDIIIKVRGGKKVAIKRTVYGKLKLE